MLEAFADVDGAADGRMLDLRAVAEARLRAAGVERIEHVDLCTACRPDLFFSHRRDDGVTGRQAGMVWRTAMRPRRGQAVRANLERVRERGRARRDVEICAAIKYVPADELPALAEGGIDAGGREPRAGARREAGRATATCSSGTSSARSRAARSRTWRRGCG